MILYCKINGQLAKFKTDETLIVRAIEYLKKQYYVVGAVMAIDDSGDKRTAA